MNSETQAQEQIIAGLKTIGNNFLKTSKHLHNVEKSCRDASTKLQQADANSTGDDRNNRH
ncbi:hypothetical protein [Vibrio gazogenes]|uniref:Uncharacterized protein n=1 Tax=Vibrio gazogenes DSM 21264 = NBRC 103151 TaxID=1123492 RepID=A0A1M4YRS9_VIBGA|nr:hypothetical protein [Vibrio gazogenes]USP15069.1 hypothetical protein MKS89_07150 [Vibrio gazogenes]SHF08212.1 hypothetical protein SAMN02745781_01411 [Vibrio gazogenes DSM 21264] [Vibrio gazogenes DSM 21264 = NBRC 103151]SJN59427.1 hypothetical protein BQ6471_03463 [Vibrio gazogenes]